MSFQNFSCVFQKFSLIYLSILSWSVFSQEVNYFHRVENWNPLGVADWSFSEFQIVGEGGDGFLVSKNVYSDFDLSVEFWVSAEANSGIFIRCQDGNNINPNSCYELNIWDEHPNQDARTGAIVGRVMPPLSKVSTAGKWNTYSISARDQVIEARVNGIVTAILEAAELSSGFIALQKWDEGEVRFRAFQIIEYSAVSSAVYGIDREVSEVIDFIPGGTASEGVTPVIKLHNNTIE